ncbi:MAG: hypothetical protein UT50_C0015G0012 [Candidatus Moranbacteria bacterium GW2011_GWA2_39_41]|nr:MAG: hypothetical protein UT50_C0015G0012 [Candidatus Moranbacteria bacterium GW2011_GWA2_39_41]
MAISKTTKYKASVLVFSLIVLSLILTSALSIGMATVSERKSSLSSNKSTQAFQVVNSVADLVAVQIKKATSSSTLSAITIVTGADQCAGGKISGNNNGAYELYFYNNSAPVGLINDCDALVSSVSKIKVVGTYSGTTRAINAPVRNHQAIVADGSPVAYWKMDENNWTASSGNVKDATTNENDGTANGGAQTTGGTGNYKIGSHAGSFDGTDDYIFVSDSDSLAIAEGKAVTMGAFIKSSDFAGVQTIFSKTSGYSLKVDNNKIVVSNGIDSCTGETELSDDQWYYIVGVIKSKSGAATVSPEIYINGKLDTFDPSCEIAVAASTGNLAYIGAGSATEEFFNGYIDEVAIYARALSQLEIQSHR